MKCTLVIGLSLAGTVCNCTEQLNELQKEMQASISAVRKEIDDLRNVTKLLPMLPHDIPSMAIVQETIMYYTANVPEKICLFMAAIFLQLLEGSVQQLTSLRTCWAISNKESQTAVQMVWLHYSSKGCHNS